MEQSFSTGESSFSIYSTTKVLVSSSICRQRLASFSFFVETKDGGYLSASKFLVSFLWKTVVIPEHYLSTFDSRKAYFDVFCLKTSDAFNNWNVFPTTGKCMHTHAIIGKNQNNNKILLRQRISCPYSFRHVVLYKQALSPRCHAFRKSFKLGTCSPRTLSPHHL